MERIKLYIFQTPRTCEVNWEFPPTGKANWLDYRKSGYYHPDVDIYIARARCLRRFNHEIIGYHIMLALQDAHMPVNALRRERAERSKASKRKISPKQMPLFPS